MNTKIYAGRLTARLFLCSKSAYTKNRISGGLFSESVTIKTLWFFRLSLFLCIGVKLSTGKTKHRKNNYIIYDKNKNGHDNNASIMRKKKLLVRRIFVCRLLSLELKHN